MMGQKGASLQSTRRIHRRTLLKYHEDLSLLAKKRERPGYDAANSLLNDCIRLGEAWLSGESHPVGTLKAVWKQVCDEYNARHPDGFKADPG
jgi:hypothetical protein